MEQTSVDPQPGPRVNIRVSRLTLDGKSHMDNFIFFGAVVSGAAIGALCAALMAKSKNVVAVERARSESHAEVAKLSERYAASEKSVTYLREELGTMPHI